jgi:hypothetical protein
MHSLQQDSATSTKQIQQQKNLDEQLDFFDKQFPIKTLQIDANMDNIQTETVPRVTIFINI